MLLTCINDLGQSFTVEIDPDMELENVMALLEVESGIPIAEQSVHFEGRALATPKATMRELGVGNDAMLLLRRKVVAPGAPGRTIEHDAEMMRLQLLGNREALEQLERVQPELAAAARNDSARFGELLSQTRARQREAEAAQQREVEALEADPYDVEAQRRIEEHIRQQAVLENMEHALEYSPESFGRVTMLYIDVEVNGHAVKAFVDSGAQQTILSPECAEACGLMRLCDRRFAGVARGVGTAKILGRVHSAPMKIADLNLACSYTIIEGREVDLLFGLDMLKAHQACIDLEKNVLRIRGREVRFLAEHELPAKARGEGLEDPEAPPSAQAPTASGAGVGFPGAGNTIGGAPSRNVAAAPAPAPPAASRHPEEAIQKIVDLGVTREQAISMLDAAGGNVEVAASLLF